MVLQFACSKAGLTLYQLDPSMAKTDPDAAKEALKQALILTKANMFFSPETHEDESFIWLAEAVIPELPIFQTNEGMPFISPRYPHLRMCIQTGYDDDEKHGWHRLHHMLVPADTVKDWLETAQRDPTLTVRPIDPSTPLMGQLVLDDRGIPTAVGPSLSNEQVIEQKAWETYCKILLKEYHEVEGVGVVF